MICWSIVGIAAVVVALPLDFAGVALLERGLTSTKPGYAAYIARTSAFVPWFPKRTLKPQARGWPAARTGTGPEAPPRRRRGFRGGYRRGSGRCGSGGE